MSYQTQGFQQDIFNSHQSNDRRQTQRHENTLNEGYTATQQQQPRQQQQQQQPQQQQSQQQVTSIELLDLDDLDNQSSMGSHNIPNVNMNSVEENMEFPDMQKYQKNIRNTTREINGLAGMNPTMKNQTMTNPTIQQKSEESYTPQIMEYQQNSAPVYSTREPITCIEIAEHVSNCPICSKLYKSDCTIYIIAIVVLAIICILLLKKTLDI
jgi:hypothetical protein